MANTMKRELSDIEATAQDTLRDVFEKVPFLKVKSIEREKDGIDIIVKLSLVDNKQILLVEVKGNGQPRMARDAVNQLIRYRNTYPDAYLIFMAPYISEQAAEICMKDGVGYLDLAGNCFISFGQVYIKETGRPNPFRTRRDLVSLFSPKSSRVLRVLLNNPGRVWKTQDLADESGVSLGQIANVKKLLLDREWIMKQDGFSLTAPWKLLEEWANVYTYRKNEVRNFYSLKSIPEIESDMAKVCKEKGIEYALTGFSGAARFAPAVRYIRAMAYVYNTREDVASLLNLKEVESGANVTLLGPYDEGVFYGTQMIDDVRIVSPLQVYLDVKSYRGRGEEAAEALLRDVIKPKWLKEK
ncbi:MAG: type IV toxin-antitoxin system AbiEi family antitoxin [Nitrospiraceae bacterium]|nr:type IV toxin-antitoxin system AbiEi family antitoxin [Nitrospiraceae bacterium]